MKQLLFSLAAFTIASFSFAQNKAADVAKFTSETIQLGNIKQGVPTTAKFMVTNISNEPLIIEQANPTCGCTISDYTKEPIAPGKTGYINATYNAANVGHFEKHLTVKFAGVDEMKSITISGDVKTPEDFAKEPVKTEVKTTNTETVQATPVKTTSKKKRSTKKPSSKK